MDISRFFIDRPRFAGVISIFIFLIGMLAILRLPVSEYPEVAPPQIVVRAQFPGANPRVISETVATPLEEQINGVENLLYFDSQASADGSLTLTVTFKIGTNPEVAETAVQNRINRALPRVARHRPPDRRDDREVEPEPDDGGSPRQPRQQPRRALPAQLRPAQRPRRAAAHSRHGLGDPVRRRRLCDARLARPGQARRAQHHHRRGDRRDPRAERAGRRRHGRRAALAQGHRVPARGQHPGPARQRGGVRRHHRPHRARDRRPDPHPRPRPGRALVGHVFAAQPAQQQGGGGDRRSSRRRDRTRSRSRTTCARKMERLKPDFPQGMDYDIVYDPTRFVQTSIEKVVRDAVRGGAAGGAGRHHLPADLARLDHPAAGGAGVDRRHLRRSCSCSATRSTR